MSADYWASSQRSKWQFTRHQLMESRRKVLVLEKKMIQNGLIKDHPNIHYDHNMRIYLHTLLVRLGRRLNIRQVALATAEVYLSRFLTRVSVKEINVYLLVTTCVYAGCKVEECPQHIRLILSEARNLWPEYIPHDVTRLAEFEFYLIEEMDSFLTLHHPYKSLIQIRDFLQQNVTIYNFRLTDDDLQNSWSLINDSYITDLPLFMPPHIIAVAAIYITIVLKKNMVQLRSEVSAQTPTLDSGQMPPPQSSDDALHIDDLMTLVNPGQPSQPPAKDLHTIQGDDEIVKINRFMNFLTHSHINLDEVVESMQDIINLYVVWNRYNESSIKKALQLMLLQR